MKRRLTAGSWLAAWLLVGHASPARAHDGPPYPIVSNLIVGAYDVSVWTDPDATDDGSAGGKFWVMLEPAPGGTPVPPTTEVHLALSATDRQQPGVSGRAEPLDGAASRRYVALPMDHEGPYAVTVSIQGPLGAQTVSATVDATYDLRPPPAAVAIYLIPFAFLAGLWAKLLWRRRRARLSRPISSP